MTDLTTTYMGLTLKNPVVPSASPLSKSVSGIVKMAESGAGAITLFSLFEEQIDFEALAQHHFLEQGSYSYAEALTYFPKSSEYNRGPEGYLDLIRQAKDAVDIPIIASLNGVTPGGWIRIRADDGRGRRRRHRMQRLHDFDPNGSRRGDHRKRLP